MTKYKFIIATIFLFICKASFAFESSALNLITKEDRVLILAPHPDDETIGAAGLIQEALKIGAKVKVALFTNGDNNELAFIVYEKRFTFRKKEFLHMGEVRRKETLAAMEFLGLNQDNIVSLGYPDFGTMKILTRYWGETKPYRSMFPRQTKVVYPEAMSPGVPYVGESILKDLKRIILDFKPTKIFVSHPADHNQDHQSLYLFLRLALWEDAGQTPQPEIFPYLIHVVGWPKPRGFHPEIELTPPEGLEDNNISWQKLALTDEEIKKKQNAVSFYKSQIECDPPYLFTFVRQNEIFGDYPMVKIKPQTTEEVDWQDLGMSNRVIQPTAAEAGRVSALAYARQGDNLLIRLTLKRKIDKVSGISLYLLGYNKKISFAKMPKIHLTVDALGLHLHDKKQTLFVKGIQLTYKDKVLIFKIPLEVLGNPDYILTSARTHTGSLSLDETAWRILDLS